MAIRTRFAPSPTGTLHIGGARTALYCWLYAKQQKGRYILRVEDTDLERSTQASVDAIFQSFDWLGLAADEEPIYQSDRLPRYAEIAARLLTQGKAYHCYCSKQELEVKREAMIAAKQKPRYDGTCRHRKAPLDGVAPIMRFANPSQGSVVFEDEVYGRIEVQNSELDDLVIMRADGMPTYNFAVVVDDSDMKISHVIRGDDHINNTPRQINLYNAIAAPVPQFAHLPMILGKDGKRLSKRHGAVSVMQYDEEGYLPEALLNYLVRLGWSHGDQEIFSLEQMVEKFSFRAVGRGGATFDKAKLDWINSEYIKLADQHRLAQLLALQLKKLGIENSEQLPLGALVELMRPRVSTLKDMAQQAAFFFQPIEQYEEKAAAKHLKSQAYPALAAARTAFSALDQWNAEAIHAALSASVEALGVGFGKVALPVRITTTGGTASPELDQTLALLGKQKTLERIDAGLLYLSEKKSEE